MENFVYLLMKKMEQFECEVVVDVYYSELVADIDCEKLNMFAGDGLKYIVKKMKLK